jgi:hypothetical protein
MLLEADLTPGQRTNVRSKALNRDHNRCLVSGAVEVNSDQAADAELSMPTEACHIIPFHLVNLEKTKTEQDVSGHGSHPGSKVRVNNEGISKAKVGTPYVYY